MSWTRSQTSVCRAAPIAVFAYNRPAHVERLLLSLAANPEAAHSPIYVFCDGPKTPTERESVNRTQRVVTELAPRHASIICREDNLGLANSIITGVTQLCSKYGCVIVLEDDLILSDKALAFFNTALNTYANDDRVMHVSGYIFPVKYPFPETFFYRSTSCWGWATWARAWQHFIADGTRIRKELTVRRLMRYFEVDGAYPYLKMLDDQIDGTNDSWAVRWYGSVTLRNGLALHPGRSLVANTGFDGSGRHCGRSSQYDVELCRDYISCERIPITEDAESVAAIKAFFASTMPSGKPQLAQARLLAVLTGLWNGIHARSLGRIRRRTRTFLRQ